MAAGATGAAARSTLRGAARRGAGAGVAAASASAAAMAAARRSSTDGVACTTGALGANVGVAGAAAMGAAAGTEGVAGAVTVGVTGGGAISCASKGVALRAKTAAIAALAGRMGLVCSVIAREEPATSSIDCKATLDSGTEGGG